MRKLAELGITTRMLVKDVMTSPVITIGENEFVLDAAKLMAENDLGCIIVTGKEEKPLGILTEKDLVVRVLAKNAQASIVRVRDIMTSPLITIDPESTLSEAARKMSHLNIRRFGVMYKGNLIGILSSKDILAVTPELIELIQEKTLLDAQTKEIAPDEETSPLAGYCDVCGRWSDTLEEVEGNFLCEECQDERKQKQE